MSDCYCDGVDVPHEHLPGQCPTYAPTESTLRVSVPGSSDTREGKSFGGDASVASGAAADSDATVERSLRTFYVPYAATEWAVVQAWLPMAEDDWDAMIAMLQVMKRGLVSVPLTRTLTLRFVEAADSEPADITAEATPND